MKIAICMWYDGHVSEYGDICREINRLYCEKHGYILIKSSRRAYKNRPSSWERFPLLLGHIENYDYVVWIDADAFFYNSAPPLEKIINHYKKDILLSADGDRYLKSDSVNSGFFILKNTKQVISILTKWVNNEELAKRFKEEVGPELEHWIEDQAMIRGSLRYNIDGIQDFAKVLPYMELQHFQLHEYAILKRHGILPYVFHAAGRTPSFRYHVSKLYLQEIIGNPLSPFVVDNFQDRPPLGLRFHQLDKDKDEDLLK
tara:strand:+ start:5521 stop:6294 length:774 start_codon:yes stop_codon:yes gene_type:complete